MLRKTMIALFAMASVAMLTPDVASARGGFGGGGFHGGGFGGGGFHGGGFGGGGFRAASIGGGGFRGAAIAGPGFRAAGWNGGWRGGGWHGGWGWRGHRGFPIAAAAIGAGLGFAAFGPWGYDPYYGYGDGYYDSAWYGDGGCYIVRQRVWTSWGWRLRRVQICD